MNERPSFQFVAPQRGASASCPYCGHLLDGWTGITGTARPDPGDASICAYCAGLLVFDLDRRPREPRDDELPDLLADPHLMAAQRAMREVIAERR